MSRDYLPQTDGAFNVWFNNFYGTLEPIYDQVGLTDEDMERLMLLREQWVGWFNGNVVAQNRAEGARLEKDARRAQAVALIRRYAAEIQANPAITDEQRRGLGLPVRSSQRTPKRTPDTAPGLIADASQRGLVRLRFGESPSDGVRNKLAPGATAVILEFRPRGGAAWRWLACATGTEFVHVVGGDSATELEFRARYAGREGDSGPCSGVVSTFAAPVAA